MLRFLSRFAPVLALMVFAPLVSAGPVIIAGTDIDDHGSATASANQEGWLFLQRALESSAGLVKNAQKVVVCLGCNGQVATSAFNSAFDKSSLPAAGWTRRSLTTAADLTSFFSTAAVPGAQTVFTSGIVYMPSDRINALGGLTEAQLDIINANAAGLAQHVASGGGLIALLQTGVVNGFGWLKSTNQNLVVDTTGIDALGTLTGTNALSAFPALNVGLLGAASHAHAHFRGPLGGLSTLATGVAGVGSGALDDGAKSNHDIAVLVGGANASLSDLGAQSVPANAPWALLIAVFGVLFCAMPHWRARKNQP